MAFADVSKPIVIQATKQAQAKVDNYLRRMCIVSQGGSNLQTGTWKEIGQAEISDILSTQVGNEAAAAELEKKLKGFFAFAGDKYVMVLEVGAFSRQTNPISSQVNFLRQYITDASLKSYCHLVPANWYYPAPYRMEIPNSTISCSTSFVGLREPIPMGDEGEPEQLPEGVNPPETTTTLDIITNVPKGELSFTFKDQDIASINEDTYELTALKEGETTLTISGKVDPTMGKNASIEIKIRVGAWDSNLELTSDEEEEKSTRVSDTTDNGFVEDARDLSFLNLANEHLQISDKVYFFIDITKNEDPSISTAFELYKGKKSVFPVYDNLVSTTPYPLSAIVLGICASSRYDFSDTQLGTPLNYKTITGQNYEPLKAALVRNLIQAPANFAGDLAGNCVLLNGRYADGAAWDYYYQWDFVEFEIVLKLQTLLLQGVNSANSVIPYNQNGIDILKANIKSVLLLWKERGLISAFSRDFDLTLGDMVGEDDISAINFDTYRVNNPEDYNNEIYKGFSFYVLIGKYPRQIFIEATLN